MYKPKLITQSVWHKWKDQNSAEQWASQHLQRNDAADGNS